HGAMREVAGAVVAAPRGPRAPRPVDALLDGLATRFTQGHVEGAPPLRRALRAFRTGARRDEDDAMRWLWLSWLVAGDLWDDDAWYELSAEAVRRARESGALNFLPLALSYRAVVHVHAGEFDVASTLIEESDAITALTGNAPLKYASLLLAAWRGADAGAAELIRADT